MQQEQDTKQEIKRSFHLCACHHAPAYMQTAFINAGYRVDYHWKTCLRSIFSLHNETLNVWTHFVGFLLFFALIIQVKYSYGSGRGSVLDLANKFHSHSLSTIIADIQAHNFTDIPHIPHAWEFEQFAHRRIAEMKEYVGNLKDHIQHGVDSVHHHMDIYLREIESSVHDLHNFHPHFPVTNFKANLENMNNLLSEKLDKIVTPKSEWPLIVFLISGCICFLGSTLFHTFGCQSQKAFYFFLKVDYSGIAVLIAGSMVPFICYIFHELTHWKYIYLSLIAVVSLAVIFVSFSERFSAEEYQPYRAALFTLMSCFFIVPFGHMLLVYGNVDASTFGKFLLSALLYVMGVTSYLLRFPERLFPGKFDIWLHSHQVFHVFIVAAAFVWYSFITNLWQGMHSHVSLL